jgi:tripartite-type tricarboxylate transporter receptor subunit TctC
MAIDARILACCCTLLAFSGAAPAAAQEDYPSRPIRMVVGFPPGGGTDVMARLIAPKLSEAWGQQVVIDNRTGATGTIGAGIVAKAAPDGYTLLMGHASSNTIAPSLFSKLTYDAEKDFTPVTLAGSVPHIIVVHPSLDVRSVKELIAHAKANPGQLTFPSAGNGSTPHLAGEIFKMMTGVNLVHVPYKGSGQSVQDLLGGQVKLAFDTTPTVMAFVKTGKLRPLAVTSPRRLASLPDVPTVPEAGVAGYEFSSWYGLFAPAGTPAAIVRKIHAEVARAQNTRDVKARMEQLGADETRTPTPEAFAAMVKSELARYAKVIRTAGIRID